MTRMTPGRLAAGALALAALLAGSAATSAVFPARKGAIRAAASGHLVVYGGRSRAQLANGSGAKLDAALAGLARQAKYVAPGSAAPAVRALNPAARFLVARNGVAYVAIDATTRADPQALKRVLIGEGLQHAAVYRNDVGGWLPLGAIERATRHPEVLSLRAALSRTHSGAITSQGDTAQGSAALRADNALNGTGVSVGILSDSYNCYSVYAQPGSGVSPGGNAGYATNGFTADASTDMSTGDLPAAGSINVLEEAGAVNQNTCMDFGAPYLLPYGDEGRAMMQIVHDVAPGASLVFHTAVESAADFASGIQGLTSAGVNVIADDVTYFDEPFFQDGLIAQAANAAAAAGVAYFSAAGNNGSNGYDNTAPLFNIPSVNPAGEQLLNLDGAGTSALSVHVPQLLPGEFIAVVLQWDQPFVTGAPNSGGATSSMDLCVSSSGNDLIGSPQNPDDPNGGGLTSLDNSQVCTGANNTGVDPYQILVIGYPANATAPNGTTCVGSLQGLATICSPEQDIQVRVGLVGGTTPGRIKLAIEDNGAGITFPGAIQPSGGTLQGHPSATGVMAVGAVFYGFSPGCGQTPATLETFSAKGGDPILFDKNGKRLASPQQRQKPDIAGPDGGNVTFLGFALGAGSFGTCMNSGAYPNFFGTSAATPHVAATAALLLQQFPGIRVSSLYTALKTGVSAVANSSNPAAVNFTGGYGFLDAENAFAALPAAPNISLNLSPTTIATGASATLSWTVTNADSCTASGAWSGAQQLSGSIMVNPTTTSTYDLRCTNADGYADASQVLTVTSGGGGGGGGGGALDALSLLALGAWAGLRRRRR
jgi:subtilisin family serine protease